MRVYVECKSCGAKIYLEDVREYPSEYPTPLNLECPNGHIHGYYSSELVAEKGGSATAAGAILGGIVGAIGGPYGVAIGASVGGALGYDQDEQEEKRVERFNETNRSF